MKRNLNQENIDIFFLLNENKILTQSELKNVLPKENYSEYIKGFYRRRFIDLFNKNYDYLWFHQIYLGEKKPKEKWAFDFKNFYYFISEIEMEEDPSKLINVLGYENHYVMFNSGYNLDIILELNELRDIKDEIQSLFFNSRVNVKIIKKEDLKVKENNSKDLKFIENNSKDLKVKENNSKDLKFIENNSDDLKVKENNSDDLKVKENNSKDLSVLPLLSNFYEIEVENSQEILKTVFLFCNICNIQYSSDVEMTYKCNKKCIAETRRKELLKNYTDFSYMKDISIDFIIKSNIIKYEENVYKCAYCEKKFESVDYINLHYQKKHFDEIAHREKKYQDFLTFIDNIDFQIIYLAEGSLEGKPWFAKLWDDNKVVYDMNHVFSGEIVLN